MIKSFADNRTKDLYFRGFFKRLPPDIMARAFQKLDQINGASDLEDLRFPPGNKLHGLAGDRAGQYSIRVNDKWRICFSFESGHAYEVELTDYH